ncbi:hypothetical protein [Pseudonocardia nigra]|uniref:hypothetical protein n=1 Tax=Pseudonocardia nigra TaxID=1921578 RepID=UPI001C5FA6AE|nr:hypothetical protein [Pseudonocardia nigra]
MSIAVAVGVLLLMRRRGVPLYERSALWDVTYPDRKKILRSIRRAEPVTPAHRDVALRAARQIERRRRLVWLWLAIALVQGANAVIQDGVARWLYLVSAACAIGAAAAQQRLRIQARRARPVLEAQQAIGQ